ncbi:MAG: hypothetical protein K8953_11915, partial [Proteobacteria bacterium]|nr:hypothetical protein [Pseudomonadota bacterium]
CLNDPWANIADSTCVNAAFNNLRNARLDTCGMAADQRTGIACDATKPHLCVAIGARAVPFAELCDTGYDSARQQLAADCTGFGNTNRLAGATCPPELASCAVNPFSPTLMLGGVSCQASPFVSRQRDNIVNNCLTSSTTLTSDGCTEPNTELNGCLVNPFKDGCDTVFTNIGLTETITGAQQIRATYCQLISNVSLVSLNFPTSNPSKLCVTALDRVCAGDGDPFISGVRKTSDNPGKTDCLGIDRFHPTRVERLNACRTTSGPTLNSDACSGIAKMCIANPYSENADGYNCKTSELPNIMGARNNHIQQCKTSDYAARGLVCDTMVVTSAICNPSASGSLWAQICSDEVEAGRLTADDLTKLRVQYCAVGNNIGNAQCQATAQISPCLENPFDTDLNCETVFDGVTTLAQAQTGRGNYCAARGTNGLDALTGNNTAICAGAVENTCTTQILSNLYNCGANLIAACSAKETPLYGACTSEINACINDPWTNIEDSTCANDLFNIIRETRITDCAEDDFADVATAGNSCTGAISQICIS